MFRPIILLNTLEKLIEKVIGECLQFYIISNNFICSNQLEGLKQCFTTEEISKFINEQLRKRYIRPSKSPQIALVIFVRKKNGKEKIVQNYRYLNEWTIKNNYPLPLILDIVENIGTKKIFTKMDL